LEKNYLYFSAQNFPAFSLKMFTTFKNLLFNLGKSVYFKSENTSSNHFMISCLTGLKGLNLRFLQFFAPCESSSKFYRSISGKFLILLKGW